MELSGHLLTESERVGAAISAAAREKADNAFDSRDKLCVDAARHTRVHANFVHEARHVPAVETWPATSTSQLLDKLSRLLRDADRRENTVLRLDGVVAALLVLSSEMPSFSVIFESIAQEVRSAVRVHDELREDIARRKQALGDANAAAQAELHEQKRALDVALEQAELGKDAAKWHAALREREAELRLAKRDSEDARLAVEHWKVRHDELYGSRRHYETAAAQLKWKNATLESKVQELSRALEIQTNRADEAMQRCRAYAERLQHLEDRGDAAELLQRRETVRLRTELEATRQRLASLEDEMGSIRNSFTDLGSPPSPRLEAAAALVEPRTPSKSEVARFVARKAAEIQRRDESDDDGP